MAGEGIRKERKGKGRHTQPKRRDNLIERPTDLFDNQSKLARQADAGGLSRREGGGVTFGDGRGGGESTLDGGGGGDDGAVDGGDVGFVEGREGGGVLAWGLGF